MKAVDQVNAIEMVPEMQTITIKSLEELRKLRIKQVSWNNAFTLGLTLSDAQTCKAGSNYSSHHTFDKTDKIIKVKCIVHDSE